jgi:uncharacterized protein YndB with AHSA1/START domain
MRSDELLVQVDHILAAPPARVFRAFTDAQLLPRWLTPSPEIAMRVDALDLREGGAYRFVYTLPDRTEVGIGGVYRTIRPPGACCSAGSSMRPTSTRASSQR